LVAGKVFFVVHGVWFDFGTFSVLDIGIAGYVAVAFGLDLRLD
jgi:hypothetical protein